MQKSSWEDVLNKMNFCKFLINLLSYKYNYDSTYDHIEGFLVIQFINKQYIHLNRLYKIELQELLKITHLPSEFNYEILPEDHKNIFMIKSVLNLLNNHISKHREYAYFNKTNIINILNYIISIRDTYKLNLEYHRRILRKIYIDIENL